MGVVGSNPAAPIFPAPVTPDVKGVLSDEAPFFIELTSGACRVQAQQDKEARTCDQAKSTVE
ncbi:MAG: hypothetical protein CL862_06810 [Cyanobium sp. NAT70]|nr:hypothetical protein [Cyanobium sp. NAT70]